jgi:hypothetical protein
MTLAGSFISSEWPPLGSSLATRSPLSGRQRCLLQERHRPLLTAGSRLQALEGQR